MLAKPVRARVITLAAEALGRLSPAQTPASLQRIANFTASKRAKLGGSAIAAALESDADFRKNIADDVATKFPGVREAIEAGEMLEAADPIDIAALAYLSRPSGWEDVVARAQQAVVSEAGDSGKSDRDAATARRLREQLDATRASAREARTALKAEISQLTSENATLKRQLAREREQLDEEEHHRSDELAEALRVATQAQKAQRSADAEIRRLRGRITELEDARASARHATRMERSAETAKLTLLLDTLSEAADGLRRELALPVPNVAPADTVEEMTQGEGRAVRHMGSPTDGAHLEQLASLPRAHVIVDGYNVTKTAWPTIPLSEQRTRLLRGLKNLAARTKAEITCIFDGGDSSGALPVSKVPGVRVRFSAPGHIADEVIINLVQAEPRGRVVVVVSSDREIAETVKRGNVYPIESVALIDLLNA